MLDNLTRRLSTVFSKLHTKRVLSEDDVNEALREIRIALLEADVNIKVAKEFVARVKEQATGQELFGTLSADQTIVKIVRDELVELLGGVPPAFKWSPSPPTVILLAGLQGSGKTTSAAKLALSLRKSGKKPMLAACDLQRPAAITQLQVLGDSIDVPVFAEVQAKDPVDVAKRALQRCKHLMLDVLIVDTAGRLQIDEDLMSQLESVAKAVEPSESFLVLDSTTGQQAVSIAQSFGERVPLTGVIFTKLDGDTRGGAILSVKAVTGLPVRYIGVGEAVDALDTFYPDRIAQRILGMGDVLGIIEKAEVMMKEVDAKQLESKIKKGDMDFNDMLQQMRMIRKMGSFKNLMKMIPGLSAALPEEIMDADHEKTMRRIEAIINSMTPSERSKPQIISGSRRKRIAAGSGVTVEDVNQLLSQLEQMKKGMKQFSKLQSRQKKMKPRRFSR